MPDKSLNELIQQIVTQLDDPIVSETVYLTLLEAGDEAVSELLDALYDKTHQQHHTIASILCDILVDVGNEYALQILRELVQSTNNEIFTPAARAIAQLKLSNINYVLCNLLDHPASQVRRVAAWQLGRNRAVGLSRCIVQHLNEPDIETLRGLIWTLGHIGDNRIIRRIEPFLHHTSTDIVFIAREAILRIEDKTLNLPFK